MTQRLPQLFLWLLTNHSNEGTLRRCVVSATSEEIAEKSSIKNLPGFWTTNINDIVTEKIGIALSSPVFPMREGDIIFKFSRD
jgi:hypothetical protein